MANFLFYLLSLGAVLAGVGVIVARNPVMSVLSLLGTFFCLAVIYLLAGFQFLAAAQVLVYAGAIMVLFLFVVMLLNLGDPESPAVREPLFDTAVRGRAGLAVAAAVLLVAVGAALAHRLPPVDPALAGTGIDSAQGLAAAMFGRHLLAFEGISLLLLVTAVGVLVLAKRQRPEREPAAQAARSRESGR